MRIGIIDAELLFQSIYSEKGKHRFPNLASMKISGYHKSIGDKVTLITEMPSQVGYFYQIYDKIYISKVFVETSVPTELLNLSNVVYGGTGFYYANAPKMSPLIESHMPDYTLYNDWIKERKSLKSTTDEFSYYEKYSLGFTTRGCVRQCKFCINQHCNKVEKASPVKDFLNEDRQYICLLDDNILAYENWREIFDDLNATGKTFEFKQGLDIRALTKEKAKVLANSNININTIYFAFDNIKDKDVIEEKLKLWRQHYRKNTHMYVLCGFDENNQYDEDFWAKDIENTLERIRICIKYGVFPYIMRHRMYNTASNPFRGMYINLSSWCNQKSLFPKWSFNEWADKIQEGNEKQLKKKRLYSSKRYLMEYAGKYPDLAYEYFDLKYNNIEHNQYIYEKEDKILNDKDLRVKIDKTFNFDITKNEEKISDIQKKNIIFAIKNKKRLLRLPKLDKLKVRKKVKNITPIIENINLQDLFVDVKRYTTNFYNGVIIPYHSKTLQFIPEKKVALSLIKFKDDDITEDDKNLLIFHQKFLMNNSNIFIFNTNLKSFTITKEFIENFTNLKFQEVIAFSRGEHKGKIEYCSRYVFKNNNNVKNIFRQINTYTRISLLNDIMKNTITKNDLALNLFEQSNFLTILDNEFNPQWISIRKKQKNYTQLATTYIKEQLSNQQTSLLESEDKNIG